MHIDVFTLFPGMFRSPFEESILKRAQDEGLLSLALHNIRDAVNYPATLITTADHDDRVVPGHSFKFAATLQEHCTGMNPELIRIDTKAGHGGGKPMTKVIDEAADEFAFMFYNLGVTPK